jgi:hypothetical protein
MKEPVPGPGTPLWSSGQNFWLQNQRSRFDYRRCQLFCALGLERGPLSLIEYNLEAT